MFFIKTICLTKILLLKILKNLNFYCCYLTIKFLQYKMDKLEARPRGIAIKGILISLNIKLLTLNFQK